MSRVAIFLLAATSISGFACAQPSEPRRPDSSDVRPVEADVDTEVVQNTEVQVEEPSTPNGVPDPDVILDPPLPQIAETPGDPNRVARPGAEAAFDTWLQEFRVVAREAGISEATLDRELASVELNRRAIELDRRQPDVGPGRALFSDYLPRRLTPQRIAAGVRIKPQVSRALEQAEERFGVPGDIVLGIWGMETAYGAITGNFDVISALATLAFDGRREALFTRELVAALRMIDEGMADRGRMKGSWAGAMGNSQFLPSSYLKHAVDLDGIGGPNIWGSETDTIGSIANYLQAYGWERGGEWAVPVSVPAGFDRAAVINPDRPSECRAPLEKHSRWLSIGEWKALGIQPTAGETLPGDDVMATLLEVDGEGTRAHLTFNNYRALLGYNCSNFYALSVGMLADEIAQRTQ